MPIPVSEIFITAKPSFLSLPLTVTLPPFFEYLMALIRRFLKITFNVLGSPKSVRLSAISSSIVVSFSAAYDSKPRTTDVISGFASWLEGLTPVFTLHPVDKVL